MTTGFTSAHRLVLLILGLGVLAVTVAYTVSGIASLMVAGTLCALLWLLRPLLLPPGYGAMRVRSMSILGVFGLAASYGAWSQLVDTAVKMLSANPQVRAVVPWIERVDLGNGPSVAVLVFAVVGVWIVNHYMADRSIAGDHPVPLKADFPEQSFQKKLDSFCSALRQHLVTTDREANWSPDYYADLEAEVEIIPMAGGVERKRVIDLQAAMRSDRQTQAFLVLGDPGAGKSVALRKLARDMLDEVGETGRVPIYVNLREWLPAEGRRNSAWSELSKPTIHELEFFVLENVKSRGDVFTEEFVDRYFRDLWKHGRLFFIFDSFDEIPELLDVNEESWLLNALSDVLSRFVSSNSQSRGVLASRVFRRPTDSFLAQKVLEIRPLSDQRIMQALERFPELTLELKRSLFRDRPDLITMMRNPFLMALLGEWANEYRTLPQTQTQLYENYLTGRLAKCASRMAQHSLSESDVFRGASDIAWFVFESPAYGLEAPVRVIDEGDITERASSIIDVLSYARVARVTQGEPKSFAFVHRRFLEYFVSMRLLEQPSDLPLEHIPTDSRGRDVMVLFAQLCDPSAAERLANLCWSEINAHFDEPSSRLRAIHSLRFLIDAFRARTAAVEPFRHQLASFISQHVTGGKSLVLAKICLEGTGLLTKEEALPILKAAMDGHNSWLHETAFRACRHQLTLGSKLERSITNYVVTMPLRQFLASRSDLMLSLSLSESLKGVQQVGLLRYRNLLLSLLATPVAFAFAPATAAFAAILYVAILSNFGLGKSLGELLRAFSIATKRVSLATLSQEWGTLFTRLMSFGVEYDHRWGNPRLCWGATLAGCGVALIGSTNFTSASSATIHKILLSSWQQGLNEGMLGLIMLLLAAMIADWLAVWGIWRALAAIVKRHGLLRLGLLLIVLVATTSAAAVALVWIGVKLREWGLDWIPVAFVSLISTFVGSVVLWSIGRNLNRDFRDYRALGRMTVTNRMRRQDISLMLDTLRSKRWRLAFVRRLARQKTMAMGDWPISFQLSVAADPALTELAKLEERWLKLDR